jgi:hypothetical protein
MTFFELNEELKEKLVLNYEAKVARTTFFKDGVLLLPEPFYETMILWDEGVDVNVIKEAMFLIDEYKGKVNENSEMTDIIFEFSLGRPSILWSTFPDKDPEEGLYD